jgi:hypothetical protein
MNELGKLLVVLGIVLAAIGAILWKTGGLGPIGRLPGDIFIKGPNSTFYFPLVTCLLISVILTLLNYFFRR